MITGEEAPNSLEKRMQARQAHLTRLKALQEAGRLLVAGPLPAGFTGSLIIASFDNLVEATDWAEADAYVTEGVFNHISVKPFRKTLP